MQRSLEKVRRRLESQIAARQGPARKDQVTAPIADAMRDFWRRDMLTFGIPAHNGGRGPPPEFTQRAGLGAARADLPMSHRPGTPNPAREGPSTAPGPFAATRGAPPDVFSTHRSFLSVHAA